MARKDLCIGIQGKNVFIDAVVQLSGITSVAKLKGGPAVLAIEIWQEQIPETWISFHLKGT